MDVAEFDGEKVSYVADVVGGGGVWESNPPTGGLTRSTGFEVRSPSIYASLIPPAISSYLSEILNRTVSPEYDEVRPFTTHFAGSDPSNAHRREDTYVRPLRDGLCPSRRHRDFAFQPANGSHLVFLAGLGKRLFAELTL